MNTKTINYAWVISLFVIGIANIMIIGVNIIGIELSDIVIRIFGLLELVALPILVFTTVRKIKNRR